MPVWVQWVIGIAALVTSIGVIWTKFIVPLSENIVQQRELKPILLELLKQFEDSPGALKVLKAISDQFRSDSGSTLKDQINRLEAAATRAATSAHEMQVAAEVGRQLAKDDRERLDAVLLRLDRLNVKSDDARQERVVIREALAKKDGEAHGAAAAVEVLDKIEVHTAATAANTEEQAQATKDLASVVAKADQKR